MSKQSAQILEKHLISQLQKLGYGYITPNKRSGFVVQPQKSIREIKGIVK